MAADIVGASQREFEHRRVATQVVRHAVEEGLADVVEDERLIERSLEGAEQIAAWAPWGTRLTKQGMWTALEIPQQAAVEYEDRQQIMALHGQAPPEAVSAFLEKRTPSYADTES